MFRGSKQTILKIMSIKTKFMRDDKKKGGIWVKIEVLFSVGFLNIQSFPMSLVTTLDC